MKFFPVAALFLILPVAAPWGQGKKPPSPEQPVVVAPVVLVSDPPTFKGTGLLAPLEKAQLSVDVAGRAISVKKRAGDRVVKGELLAEFRNTDLELDLGVLQARFLEVTAERTLSRQKQARVKNLFQQKLATEEQFENENASAAVTEARVASMKAQVARLETLIGLMKVRAPFAGQVVSVDLEIGQWVVPNKPIFEIFNYDRMELMLGMPGRFLNKVSPNIPVVINIPEIGQQLQGRIEAVVRHVQANNGNFQLRISADNPKRTGVSGLLAQVEVPVGAPGQAMTVPRDAIVRRGGKTLVVVARDGKASPVPVTVTGNLANGTVIVTGPLKPGEEVVVRGNERLRPGAPVRVTGKL